MASQKLAPWDADEIAQRWANEKGVPHVSVAWTGRSDGTMYAVHRSDDPVINRPCELGKPEIRREFFPRVFFVPYQIILSPVSCLFLKLTSCQ